MFIDDYIEKISLKEEVKNLKSMLETLASENLELKDQNDMLKDTLIYQNQEISVLKKEAVGGKLCLGKDDNEDKIKELGAKIETLENDRSELLAIHTADVETINKLNIKVRDLNSTISTLLERVSKTDKENQELKKKVQDLNDFIQRI